MPGGLTLIVIGETEVPVESGLAGLIASQDQPAGTSVRDGSTVQVTIGVLPPPTTTTTTTTTTITTTTTVPPTTTTTAGT